MNIIYWIIAYAKHKRENSLIKAAFNQVFSSLSDLSDPALTLKEEKKHSEKIPGQARPVV